MTETTTPVPPPFGWTRVLLVHREDWQGDVKVRGWREESKRAYYRHHDERGNGLPGDFHANAEPDLETTLENGCAIGCLTTRSEKEILSDHRTLFDLALAIGRIMAIKRAARAVEMS